MKSEPLQVSGAVFLDVSLATFDGKSMETWGFLVDTGATRTTVPKRFLVKLLGYTEEFIQSHKILLSEKDKPTMADGNKADLYKVKAPRMNISGHEIQNDYILTSDSVTSLNSLLGLDILSYFNFSFNFDATDIDAPHGKLLYEFRQSRLKPYTKLDEPFAYKLNDSSE
ncbi:MAG: hypothetical protein FWC20_11700 [Oscillospiraceae bacterium]|nr:hypothetical protein [Oscillospiraceae bacterium]MCL2280047.1 hypothetical protein [Oscillospiraceae bacterium]